MLNTWQKFWLRVGYLHCLKISPPRLLICCKQKIVIMQKKTCTIPWPNDLMDIVQLPIRFTFVGLWLKMRNLNGIMRKCQSNTNGEHVIIKRKVVFCKKCQRKLRSCSRLQETKKIWSYKGHYWSINKIGIEMVEWLKILSIWNFLQLITAVITKENVFILK